MLHLEIHAPPAQSNPLELAIEALRDPQPLLFALGENLLHSTRERFARQHSPEGIPWQALSPRYAARKPALLSNRNRARGKGKARRKGKARGSTTRGSTARGSTTQGILRLFGHMKGTLTYQVHGPLLLVGSPRLYAATHQFGRKDARIPARPFLGLSPEDRRAIDETTQAWLQGRLQGRL